MLTMLEEVVLLAVDEKSGNLRSTREFSTAYALVGAAFFDLALNGNVDTDTETIRIIHTKPTGSAILDRILADLSQRPDLKTVRDWIEELYRKYDLEGEALKSLTARGILRHEKSKLLWIIDVESFPMVDNQPQQHVSIRLAKAVLGDEIPETRDIMLVSIAAPCGLLNYVLSDTTVRLRRSRIDTLANLETISRKVNDAIESLEASIRHHATRVE